MRHPASGRPHQSDCVFHLAEGQDDQHSCILIGHARMANARLDEEMRLSFGILGRLVGSRASSHAGTPCAPHRRPSIWIRMSWCVSTCLRFGGAVVLSARLAGSRSSTGEHRRLGVTWEAGRPSGHRVPGCRARRSQPRPGAEAVHPATGWPCACAAHCARAWPE